MRRRSGRGQGVVSEALTGLYGTLESGTQIRESLALAHWAEVVGPQAAAATEADVVRGGTLFVRTKSSVWSHELTLHKSHLLAELNRKLGRPVIKDIVFRAQGVKRKDSPPDTPEELTEETVKLVVLPPADQFALNRELDELGSIRDDKMRQSIAGRIIRDKKLRRWQLDHGWKQCSREGCTALHNTEEEYCPICRVCRTPYLK
jgi:predicted nucleic acid-binding Zn ribbon protein